MSTIQIRHARPDDAATIAAFQVRMARESEGLELDPATVRQGVQAVFDDPAKGRYWVAEDEGRNATVLWIHSLYVVPEARRRGVFRALFLTLKRQVEASPELAGLRLYVEKGNALARQAYEALGMTAEHYDLYEWLK